MHLICEPGYGEGVGVAEMPCSGEGGEVERTGQDEEREPAFGKLLTQLC
ncbi:hypothetical protein GCM10022295_92360 [Streptomyces osmaniensis]|uniref:Uncharacterized protein n=1 Tax=Streptomyces osmaniensis TaxID=593134 RepID=A0ABP6Z3E3_9ACTN